MEKILFCLALIFAVLAITSRHHFKKDVQDIENSDVEVSLVDSPENPKSLTYALNKMTGTKPASLPQTTKPLPAPGKKPHDEVIKDVEKYVKDIQMSDENSPYAFENGLNVTSDPADLPLRLTVLQAALSMQGDSSLVRTLAMREASNVVVVEGGENQNSENSNLRDIQRNVVITAFKVYLQASPDPDVTYNDTLQILNFQSDQWVRRQIIFEATSRFPQLREKLNE